MVKLRKFTANFYLLALVDTILFMPTAAILLANVALLIIRSNIVQSRMYLLTLRHVVGTAAVGRDLLNVRQYHHIAVLLVVVAISVANIVINRVTLLAPSVQALAHGHLTRLLRSLLGLDHKFLFIKRLLLGPEVIALRFILQVQIQSILLLADTTHVVLLLRYIVTLQPDLLVVYVQGLDSLRVNPHLLLLGVARVVQRR